MNFLRRNLQVPLSMATIGKGMPVPIVDLFAGPGGLGEGFASLKGHRQQPFFENGLSIEKSAVAHRTLTLRAVFRRLRGTKNVEHYYSYIRGDSDESSIDGEIRAALKNQETWVLIGGTLRQAYSLASC